MNVLESLNSQKDNSIFCKFNNNLLNRSRKIYFVGEEWSCRRGYWYLPPYSFYAHIRRVLVSC